VARITRTCFSRARREHIGRPLPTVPAALAFTARICSQNHVGIKGAQSRPPKQQFGPFSG